MFTTTKKSVHRTVHGSTKNDDGNIFFVNMYNIVNNESIFEQFHALNTLIPDKLTVCLIMSMNALIVEIHNAKLDIDP